MKGADGKCIQRGEEEDLKKFLLPRSRTGNSQKHRSAVHGGNQKRTVSQRESQGFPSSLFHSEEKEIVFLLGGNEHKTMNVAATKEQRLPSSEESIDSLAAAVEDKGIINITLSQQRMAVCQEFDRVVNDEVPRQHGADCRPRPNCQKTDRSKTNQVPDKPLFSRYSRFKGLTRGDSCAESGKILENLPERLQKLPEEIHKGQKRRNISEVNFTSKRENIDTKEPPPRSISSVKTRKRCDSKVSTLVQSSLGSSPDLTPTENSWSSSLSSSSSTSWVSQDNEEFPWKSPVPKRSPVKSPKPEESSSSWKSGMSITDNCWGRGRSITDCSTVTEGTLTDFSMKPHCSGMEFSMNESATESSLKTITNISTRAFGSVTDFEGSIDTPVGGRRPGFSNVAPGRSYYSSLLRSPRLPDESFSPTSEPSSAMNSIYSEEPLQSLKSFSRETLNCSSCDTIIQQPGKINRGSQVNFHAESLVGDLESGEDPGSDKDTCPQYSRIILEQFIRIFCISLLG